MMLLLLAVGQGPVRITTPRWAATAVRVARASRSRLPVGATVGAADRRVPPRSGVTRG